MAQEKVQPLLDVCVDGHLLQRAAHVLGDAHEAVPEDGKPDRVYLAGADGLLVCRSLGRSRRVSRGRWPWKTG